MLSTDVLPRVVVLSDGLNRDAHEGSPAGMAREADAQSRRSHDGRHAPFRARAPLEPQWFDVWLMVTPVWAVLALSRVLFYGLERLRYPELIPPVSADAIQSLLLWPLVVVGCHLTLSTWRRAGRYWTIGAALATAFVVGAVARPAYAIASLFNSGNDGAQDWLDFLYSTAPGFWYAWLANAVEYGVLYLSCVAVTVGFLSYRSLMNERLLRTRVEASAAQERLRALRAQLNPHFLFNTLNSIVSLSDAQSPTAQQLITQLSDLLRRTLRASECEEHELSEELAYIEAYLRIQHIRQPFRINWRVRVDVQCATAAVPSLILLPLVENAVTHGLRGGASAVDVEIQVDRDCDSLVMTVSNTCAMPAPGESAGRSGLGLRNVRERLEVSFGALAVLSVQRTAPNRFETRIRLPLRERPAVISPAWDVTCES